MKRSPLNVPFFIPILISYVTERDGSWLTEFKGCCIEKFESGCRQVENNQPTDVTQKSGRGQSDD